MLSQVASRVARKVSSLWLARRGRSRCGESDLAPRRGWRGAARGRVCHGVAPRRCAAQQAAACIPSRFPNLSALHPSICRHGLTRSRLASAAPPPQGTRGMSQASLPSPSLLDRIMGDVVTQNPLNEEFPGCVLCAQGA